MKDPRETIKQLLRLAKDPTAAEAGRALAKARDLALKHCLTLEELQLEADLEPIAEKAFRVGQRISYEHKLAAGVAEEHFNVEVLIGRPDLLIFGTVIDIAIAEYVIDYLVGSSRRALSKFRAREKKARRQWSTAKRTNYLLGFFSGIHSVLMPPEGELPAPDQAALVLRHNARIKAFISDRYSGQIITRKPAKRRTNRAALGAGYTAGRTVRIHDPLESRPTHLLGHND